MSDPYTQRQQVRGLEQTRTIERPGAPGFDTFYATGTWTPAFQGSGTAGVFTYIAGGQTGYWTRIGNQVIIHAYINISAIGTPPTGFIRITGLPFTSANVNLDSSLALGYVNSIDVSPGVIQLTAHVSYNSTYISLFEMFDNATSFAYPAANFTNVNAAIEVSGAYQV